MSLGGKYHLIDDIDMTGVDWTPLGNYDSPFTGTLDGQGYVIKNLNIDTTVNGSLPGGLQRKRFSPEAWDFANDHRKSRGRFRWFCRRIPAAR